MCGWVAAQSPSKLGRWRFPFNKSLLVFGNMYQRCRVRAAIWLVATIVHPFCSRQCRESKTKVTWGYCLIHNLTTYTSTSHEYCTVWFQESFRRTWLSLVRIVDLIGACSRAKEPIVSVSLWYQAASGDPRARVLDGHETVVHHGAQPSASHSMSGAGSFTSSLATGRWCRHGTSKVAMAQHHRKIDGQMRVMPPWSCVQSSWIKLDISCLGIPCSLIQMLFGDFIQYVAVSKEG